MSKLLAESPELLTATDYEGQAALHHAAAAGKANVVNMLLAANPSLATQQDSHGCTALHHALKMGHERVFAQLLAACPETINARDRAGTTILQCAVKAGHETLVAQILAARPQLVDQLNEALDNAIGERQPRVAETLLEVKPGLISRISSNGRTVLHGAIDSGFDRQLIIKMWQMYPQALKIEDNESETPFDLAVTLCKDKLIQAFQGSMSFNEIASAFAKSKTKAEVFQARYRPVMEAECEELRQALTQEEGDADRVLLNIVFEYIGFASSAPPAKSSRSRKPTKRAKEVDAPKKRVEEASSYQLRSRKAPKY